MLLLPHHRRSDPYDNCTEGCLHVHVGQSGVFVEKIKSPHFESQETIASKLNLEKKAVGKILRGFIETGVLRGEKKKPDEGGQIQWFYNWVCKDLLFDSTKKSSTVVKEMKNLKQSNIEYDDDLPEWAK